VEKGQAEMQRKQAAHAISLYLGIDQLSTVRIASVFPSAPSPTTRENSKNHLSVTSPVTQEPPANMAPLIPKTPKEASAVLNEPIGPPMPTAVATGKVQPTTGASWVTQFCQPLIASQL